MKDFTKHLCWYTIQHEGTLYIHAYHTPTGKEARIAISKEQLEQAHYPELLVKSAVHAIQRHMVMHLGKMEYQRRH